MSKHHSLNYHSYRFERKESRRKSNQRYDIFYLFDSQNNWMLILTTFCWCVKVSERPKLKPKRDKTSLIEMNSEILTSASKIFFLYPVYSPMKQYKRGHLYLNLIGKKQYFSGIFVKTDNKLAQESKHATFMITFLCRKRAKLLSLRIDQCKRSISSAIVIKNSSELQNTLKFTPWIGQKVQICTAFWVKLLTFCENSRIGQVSFLHNSQLIRLSLHC